MMVITVRNDGRDRKGADSMPRREAAFRKVGFPIVEKCVVEGATGRNRDWALALRDCFQSDIDDFAVNERFSRKQAGVHLIRIVTYVTCGEQRKRNECRLGRRDGA